MRSILLVFLGACSYGILSTFVKKAYDQGFTVDEVTGSQMLFGLAMMILVDALSRIGRTRASTHNPIGGSRLSLPDRLKLMLLGTTIAATGMLYYSALQTLPASLAIVLLFQFAWIGVLLDGLLTRTSPGRLKWTAVGVLVLGTILAGNVVSGGLSGFSAYGVALGFLSAVSYSLFILFSGRVAPEAPPLPRSVMMLTGAALLTFIVYPPRFLVNGALSEGLFLWAFLIALFGAVIPTLFYAIGVPGTGGSLASILSAAELPTAIILSAAVLGEHVTSLQWLGVAVILIGIALPEAIPLWEARRTGCPKRGT